MTRIQQFFHYFDTVGQFLLVSIASLFGVASLITGGETGAYFFLTLFGIGCWQLISAFVRGLGFSDESKMIYFFTALFYCFLLLIVSPQLEVSHRWEMPLLVWFVGVVPMVGAFWYLTACIMSEEQSELV